MRASSPKVDKIMHIANRINLGVMRGLLLQAFLKKAG